MKQFISVTLALIFSTLLFNSCSFEDEIVLDPGKLIIKNPGPSTFEISVRNMDMNEVEYQYIGEVQPNGSLEIDMDKGYSYNVYAKELKYKNPLIIYETVLIKAHSAVEWVIPYN
jgi:hypothetical protein